MIGGAVVGVLCVWNADTLEEWWQREYAKKKPLDASYHAFTFDPNGDNNNRRKTRRSSYHHG